MNGDLKKLYSDIIKEHQSSPFHFEKRSDLETNITAYNPICGDRFDVYFSIDSNGPVITEFYFHGFGCAVSKASASVMGKTMLGKSRNEALALCKQFIAFINNELTGNDLILPDEFAAFSGVHEFPERTECATLTWKEMLNYLEQRMPS